MVVKTIKTTLIMSAITALVIFDINPSLAAGSSDQVALAQFQQSVDQMQDKGHGAVIPKSNVAEQGTDKEAVLAAKAEAIQSKPAPTPVAEQSGDTMAGGPTLVKQPTVQQLMAEAPNNLQKAAFKGMVQQAMPLTPSQIIDLKRRLAASQRASSISAEKPPTPVTSSRIVNLAPGATPPVIRLQQGFITTLDFVGASGSPWPVHSIDNGNPDAFNISWDQHNNTLMIQARKPYVYGNLAVSLKGLNTPIMLTLVPGQNVVDYRVDLRVSGLAPGAKLRYSNGHVLPPSANKQLLRVLDGIAPEKGKQLRADGNAQVWLVGSKMYVRTRFAILSPGWIGHMRSPDGTNAYEIQKTPSILISQFGSPVQVKVEGL